VERHTDLAADPAADPASAQGVGGGNSESTGSGGISGDVGVECFSSGSETDDNKVDDEDEGMKGDDDELAPGSSAIRGLVVRGSAGGVAAASSSTSEVLVVLDLSHEQNAARFLSFGFIAFPSPRHQISNDATPKSPTP
jgi:hypothetical protein